MENASRQFNIVAQFKRISIRQTPAAYKKCEVVENNSNFPRRTIWIRSTLHRKQTTFITITVISATITFSWVKSLRTWPAVRVIFEDYQPIRWQRCDLWIFHSLYRGHVRTQGRRRTRTILGGSIYCESVIWCQYTIWGSGIWWKTQSCLGSFTSVQ